MRQFTVSMRVVVWDSDPEVAATVTVDMTGGGEDTTEDAPPQPLSRLRPATLSKSSTNICKRRRLFQPKQHSATARTDPGKSGRELRWSAAVVAAVVTVSVVEATPPDGVTIGGAKLHEAPAGNPEQAKETAELKPFSGVTETVVVPLCPPVTESNAGVAATVKPGVATCVTT